MFAGICHFKYDAVNIIYDVSITTNPNPYNARFVHVGIRYTENTYRVLPYIKNI